MTSRAHTGLRFIRGIIQDREYTYLVEMLYFYEENGGFGEEQYETFCHN